MKRDESGERGASTRSVHAGEGQDSPRAPVVTPIHQTAPFLFSTSEELRAAFAGGGEEGLYSRYANPSVRVVEEKVAALEGAEDAVAFASGMAAVSGALAALTASGDRLLAARDVYGGTHGWLGWLERHHPEIEIERTELSALAGRVEDGASPAPSVVFVESPTNPLLAVCDLERLARGCRARGALLVVDNTFATPVLQRPLALGAHLVVHSATKFLAGHSDVTAGVAAGPADLVARVREVEILGGACLDPHAAFLVARGMRTLALRVERQSANAERLAAFLADQPSVRRVHYPGDDPVARRQMRAGGGMLAFDLADAAAAARFVDALQVIGIIPSLGGVESGVLLPATTSHRQLSREERERLGIGEGLVRLSCGIEDGDDLEADVARALAAV